mmetsp:Transcript_27880/g.76682  ORF Transcript_27880/g.76682 Transcript_27880/m.76682 type:complete len:231 (+) Transcript_27880:33-725(+)
MRSCTRPNKHAQRKGAAAWARSQYSTGLGLLGSRLGSILAALLLLALLQHLLLVALEVVFLLALVVVLLLQHGLPLLGSHRLWPLVLREAVLGLLEVIGGLDKSLCGALRAELLHHLLDICKVPTSAAHVHWHHNLFIRQVIGINQSIHSLLTDLLTLLKLLPHRGQGLLADVEEVPLVIFGIRSVSLCSRLLDRLLSRLLSGLIGRISHRAAVDGQVGWRDGRPGGHNS